jgi:hypothetical protein
MNFRVDSPSSEKITMEQMKQKSIDALTLAPTEQTKRPIINKWMKVRTNAYSMG